MPKIRITALLLPLAISALLAGCVGQIARRNVQAPQIDSQAVDVVRYARAASPHNEDQITAFDLARGNRNWPAALAAWPSVQADALRGIDAGPESEGVKGSFREQVKRLDASLRKAVSNVAGF